MANRFKDKVRWERVQIPFTHAAVTADTAEKLWTVPTGRTFRLEKVWYNNPTGLAQDAANYFDIQIKKDATVMANWSTLTGAQGTLTADTPVSLVLGAASALDAAADAVISLNLDETGTATLPAGRGMIEGYLL